MTGRPGQLGGVADDNRRFLNAVIYINKTGVPCRDLPLSFGLWDAVYHRFNEWCKKGRWQRISEALQDPDLEWLMIDSTVIRAHQHAAGLNTDANDEDLGRSRGGFGTKIHAGFDALGNPVAFELSPGQEADVTHAEAVIGDRQPEVVIGDMDRPTFHGHRVKGVHSLRGDHPWPEPVAPSPVSSRCRPSSW